MLLPRVVVIGILAAADSHVVRRASNSDAEDLKVLMVTYNAGNANPKEGEHVQLYESLTAGHEDVDVVVLALQEHKPHFEWPVAELWKDDMNEMRKKYFEPLEMEAPIGGYQSKESAKIFERASAYLERYPTAQRTPGTFSSAEHYASLIGTIKGLANAKNWNSEKWKYERETFIKGPQDVPQYDVLFDSGVVCRQVKHFDTALRIFVRPSIADRFDIVESGTLDSTLGTLECGKVVNYAVFKVQGPTKTTTLCVLNTHMSFKKKVSDRAEFIERALAKVDAISWREAKHGCTAVAFGGDFNTRSHCEESDKGMHYSRVPPWQRGPLHSRTGISDKPADVGSTREIVRQSCKLQEDAAYTWDKPGELVCSDPGQNDEMTQLLENKQYRCYEKKKGSTISLSGLYMPVLEGVTKHRAVECWCKNKKDELDRRIIGHDQLTAMQKKFGLLDFNADVSEKLFGDFVTTLGSSGALDAVSLICEPKVSKNGDKNEVPPTCRGLSLSEPDEHGRMKISVPAEDKNNLPDALKAYWVMNEGKGFPRMAEPLSVEGLREAAPVTFAPPYRHGLPQPSEEKGEWSLWSKAEAKEKGLDHEMNWKICYTAYKWNGWPKIVSDKTICGNECRDPKTICLENPKNDGKRNPAYTDRILVRGDMKTLSYGWQTPPNFLGEKSADHAGIAARLSVPLK